MYYEDSYTLDFTARVVERMTHQDRPAVVLDRTYFYPTGGGQPNDTGHVAKAEVADVISRPEDHAVLHLLASEIEEDVVACRIDRPRRLDHMQQHTGQHILTRAFIEVANANTVAFHLGSDSVTIDLDTPSLAPAALDRVEDLANQIVIENRPITARVVSQDEFAALNVRTRKVPEQLATDGIRVVEIADFDLTACGGTHVARAGEIGLIKVLKLERNANETRVEFRCGGRALSDYRIKNAMANRLAADLTVGHRELDQAVARLKGDLKDARGALKETQGRLLEYEAASLLASAQSDGTPRIVKAVFENREIGEARALANRLVEADDVIALIGIAGEKAQLIFGRSQNLQQDMNAILKQALAVLKTDRGGGRPEFAQGGGVAATRAEIAAALENAIRGLAGSGRGQ